jgi:hypothetical protein
MALELALEGWMVKDSTGEWEEGFSGYLRLALGSSLESWPIRKLSPSGLIQSWVHGWRVECSGNQGSASNLLWELRSVPFPVGPQFPWV